MASSVACAFQRDDAGAPQGFTFEPTEAALIPVAPDRLRGREQRRRRRLRGAEAAPEHFCMPAANIIGPGSGRVRNNSRSRDDALQIQ